MTKRVLAEIDLSAIRHNILAICEYVGLRIDVMPVVKADAYGHGMIEVARVAALAGIEWLGVATVAEGVAIRQALPGVNVCVFAPFSKDEAEAVVLNHLTPFVGELDSARELGIAGQKVRGGARIHLEVDTGMGRSGVLPDQAVRLAEYIARLPAILITGMCTHFPCAEDDPDFTAEQLSALVRAAEAVQATDTLLQHVHAANSAALLRYPTTRLNMVRPGLLTYGIVPAVPGDTPVPPVVPALRLKTRIALMRTLPAGHTLSYGRTHKLKRQSKIATIPMGYGDGYPRALGNNGEVLVAGCRAPIVGRVCMDVTLIDVTDVPDAGIGSEVVLIGSQGEEQITVEEVARRIDTTEHDVTTRLTARVPRVYVNGK